eukprot:TRINITY_DN27160_c0_g1_i1.p1 TRINITY_DN27160_c0_g1~~TRINITY_DN27160_c0_g1_i1.p1  ORF type:complete len:1165 (-),score=493.85 TRINITY_DN27160_c0_g1_i1:226-3546(-)
MEGINAEHYRSDRELCREKQRELKKKKNILDRKEGEVEDFKDQLKPLEQQYNNVLEEEKGYGHLQSLIMQAETKLQGSRDAQRDLRRKMDEVFDDDVTVEDLQDKMHSLQDFATSRKDKVHTLEKEVNSLLKKEKVGQVRLQKNAASLGKLQSDKDKNEKDKRDRDALRVEAEDMLNDNIESSDLVTTLKEYEDKVKTQLSKFKIDRNEREAKIVDEIDEVKSAKVMHEEKKKRGHADLMDTKNQIAKLKRELAQLEGADEEISMIKEELDNKKEELEQKKRSVDVGGLQKEIKTDREKIVKMEKTEEKLREELKPLEEQQALNQQIQYLSKDIKTKSEKKDQILNKRNSELLEIFDELPDIKRLKTSFKAVQNSTESELKAAMEKKQKLVTAIASKGEFLAQLKKEKAVKIRKERELHAKVEDVLDDSEDLETELAKCKDRLDELRKELQVKEAGRFTYKELLERMQKMQNPACPTCHRRFEEKADAELLAKSLEDMIREIPHKVQGLEMKVAEQDARYHKLQKIVPEYHQHVDIKKSLQDLVTQIQNLDKDQKDLKEKTTSIEGDYERIQERSYSLSVMADDVQMIDNLLNEIKGLEGKLNGYKEQCPSLDPERTLDTVKQELEQLADTIKSTRKACEQKQDDYNSHTTKMNNLESAYNKLVNRKLEIEGRQQQRANTMDKKSELEQKVGTIQEGIKEAQQELEPLKERLEELETERDRFKQKKDMELDRIQTKVRELEKLKYNVEKLDQKISDYERSDNAWTLEKNIKDKKEIESELEDIKERRDSADKEKMAILQEISNQDKIKRNLLDNLELRKLSADEVKYEANLAQHKQKLQSTDYARVNSQKLKITQAMEEINCEIHSRLGQIAEIKKSVADIQMELSKPKLKNANKMYYQSWVKHGTLKMAVDDLNQYYIALDFAITSFHREKMKLVNRLIREMWRNTYRGNDIDYIEIRTDDGEIASGADKRKSYNYRVVMVKNDVEMDMRGRCSAGQKVLASLIIRLALAETFAENCGIIALDEPTTNLDRDNIESLACALSSIAADQAVNRHFQLVVITHDEEFIEQLSRCDKIQYYQKVSRNSNGLSEIRKMNVTSLEGVSEE